MDDLLQDTLRRAKTEFPETAKPQAKPPVVASKPQAPDALPFDPRAQSIF